MTKCLSQGLVLGLLLVICGQLPAAAAGAIEQVEPAEVSQGDTVLLTIRGSELPQGSLVVEFFPQQIAVLDILASSDAEIVVQCKVPNLAQPGQYNILIYNQLGIEVFRENALVVKSALLTPVFTAYSPRAFVEAEGGFALMLTGELLTAEVLPLLSVNWSREGTELPGLTTSLALAGAGTVVAAVSGAAGAGPLRGTIRLGPTPIYMVDIEIYRSGTEIYGMSPAEANGNAEWIAVKLVGEGLTNMSSSSLTMHLSAGKRKYAAQSISVLNDSSAQGSFPGPLEAGQYELTVERDGQLLYTSPLSVIWVESAVPEEAAAEGGQIGLPTEGSGVTPEPFESGSTGATDGEGAAIGITGSKPLISGISVVEIPAGTAPIRLDLVGVELTTAVFDRLQSTMEVGSERAELVLATNLGGQFSLIFAPRLGEWTAGSSAVLRVVDPAGEYAPYEVTLPVTSGQSAVLPVAAETPAQTWNVATVNISSSGGQSVMEIRYSGSAAQLDPAGFSGSYSLKPRASGIEDHFANLSTAGDLAYHIGTDGVLTATASGNFVSGSLLARTKYLDGPQELAIVQLETADPRAVLRPPAILLLQVNSETHSVSPEILGWDIEFAPFIPVDPTLVQLAIPETGGMPAGLSSYVDGTRLHLSLVTAQALPAGTLPAVLTCEFSSNFSLSWNRDPVDVLQIETATAPIAELQLEIAKSEAELTADGFDLSLLPTGDPPGLAQWSEVKLHADNDLLNQRINGFTVRAVDSEIFSRQGVTLQFRRNRSLVSDADYQALVDSLVRQGRVLITLSWAALGIEQVNWISFTAAAP